MKKFGLGFLRTVAVLWFLLAGIICGMVTYTQFFGRDCVPSLFDVIFLTPSSDEIFEGVSENDLLTVVRMTEKEKTGITAGDILVYLPDPAVCRMCCGYVVEAKETETGEMTFLICAPEYRDRDIKVVNTVQGANVLGTWDGFRLPYVGAVHNLVWIPAGYFLLAFLPFTAGCVWLFRKAFKWGFRQDATPPEKGGDR